MGVRPELLSVSKNYTPSGRREKPPVIVSSSPLHERIKQNRINYVYVIYDDGIEMQSGTLISPWITGPIGLPYPECYKSK
jgi:hypothetical protein